MSKRGRTLHSQAREMICKLHEYFESECQTGGPLLPVTQVQQRVAQALGVGTPTVGRVLKERYGPTGIDNNPVHSPKKRRRSKPITGIDNFDTDAIRNHVYSYFTRGEYPVIRKLIVSLKEAGLFNGSKSSLLTILKNTGFEFKKCDRRKILMERFDLKLERVTFLRKVNSITDWNKVIFLDETWLNANHSVSKSWTDDSPSSSTKVPIGKGGRLIICHAGSAGGFIDNCLLAFESKSTKEYHEEMDSHKFIEWFKKLLEHLPDQCAIIMDNAPYHSIQIDKPPSTSKNKAEHVAWLQRNGVQADMDLLKEELIKLVNEHKPRTPRYVIDELAREHGHQIIRTPPYHCQYNAIELIWAQVKGYAARHNTVPPFTPKKMMGLLKEACNHVTKNDWEKVVEKTRKLIAEDFERDVHIDNLRDNELIFFVSDNEDSSSESE